MTDDGTNHDRAPPTDDSRSNSAEERSSGRATPTGTSSRRTFMQTAAGAGLLGLGLGSGAVGSTAAAGIPTPWLTVEGNELQDPQGNQVILRGVNVVDPARAAEEWRKDVEPLIELATDASEGWHAHVIRLPMQPQDIGGHGTGTAAPTPGFTEAQLQTYLEEYVDPAVQTAADVGAYVVLDYHRHYPWGPDWDSPELDTEIRRFWNAVAPRYADQSHVIYELYNEPTTPYPGAGDPTENVAVTDSRAEQNYLYWRETAQPWVDLIRSHASQNPIVIGSPRWSQFTYWADEHQFDGENLAYAGHVYAHQNLRPLSTYFGKPAETVPVFLSEFGYGQQGADYLTGTNADEGREFLEFFDEYDVHWQVWCFDHTWSPGMLNRDYEVASPHGQLFMDRLHAKRNADLPVGSAGGDEQAPTAPANLASPEQRADGVDLEWAAASDRGGSGLDHYAVFVDGALDHRVPAGSTSTSVGGLLADASYEFAVTAVDGAGNVSDASAPITVATEPSSTQRLVLHDFDGDPGWPGGNELGNWAGAGSFDDGGGGDGTVVDGRLRVEYADSGWLQSYVSQDLSAYDHLKLQLRGENGGEEATFAVELGGVSEVLSNLTDDAIGTASSTVSVDMGAAGMDAVNPSALYLDFWSGTSRDTAIEIDEIWFE